MKASEIVSKFQELIKEFGDKDVTILDYDASIEAERNIEYISDMGSDIRFQETEDYTYNKLPLDPNKPFVIVLVPEDEDGEGEE